MDCMTFKGHWGRCWGVEEAGSQGQRCQAIMPANGHAAACWARPQAAAEGSLLSDEELWTVAWEVASGLEFLHAHGVLHLDVKPDNIYR